jgi:hypothetical protein
MKFRPSRNGGYYARKDHTIYCTTYNLSWNGESTGDKPYSVRIEYSPCYIFQQSVDLRGLYQFATVEEAMALCEKLASGEISVDSIRKALDTAYTQKRQAERDKADAKAANLIRSIQLAGISLETFRTLIRAYNELPKGAWEIISKEAIR